MKDSIARDDIKNLRRGLDKLERKEPDFVIRQCPKCKHETVQVKKWDYNYTDTLSARTLYAMANPFYTHTTCTNCGMSIECVTETVCKEYKD